VIYRFELAKLKHKFHFGILANSFEDLFRLKVQVSEWETQSSLIAMQHFMNQWTWQGPSLRGDGETCSTNF